MHYHRELTTGTVSHLGNTVMHLTTPAPALPVLTEGRIVHYVAYNSRHLAAIVIGHDGNAAADLAVFTNMENVNNVKNFGLQFHQNIAHSETKEPGTWHYIEEA